MVTKQQLGTQENGLVDRRDLMIHEDLYDEHGNERSEISTIHVKVDEEGNIISVSSGGKIIGVSSSGLTFVVDNKVLEQINKFKINGRNLELIDGMELDEPVKSDAEIEREKLLKQIAELDKQIVADTEENTETPAP